MKILILLLMISNTYAQDMFNLPNPVKNLFKDSGVRQNNKNGKTSFSFFKNKRKGKYKIFCYAENGTPIARFSNIDAVKVESLVFYYDIYLAEGKMIRVPASKCFLEENLK